LTKQREKRSSPLLFFDVYSGLVLNSERVKGGSDDPERS
jgi:hypothetical protein